VTTRFGMEVSAVGTVRYMAPEVVFGAYTYKADIYSYGMLLWELLHVAEPFGNIAAVTVLFQVHYSARPSIGPLPRALQKHGDIVEACWAQNFDERPQMDEVLRRLELAALTVLEGSRNAEQELTFQNLDDSNKSTSTSSTLLSTSTDSSSCNSFPAPTLGSSRRNSGSAAANAFGFDRHVTGDPAKPSMSLA